MYRINVVDDEKDLLLLIKRYLEKEGYTVGTFSSGEDALSSVNEPVHLWLLDIMMQGDISGYDLIKEIKRDNPVPVIFVSARNQEFDRVMGLEMGSDDYITKPFVMRELVLRVNNIIKRVYGTGESYTRHYGDYRIDLKRRLVLLGDKTIALTSKETDMVMLFMENLNVSFTRDQLLNRIWGNDYFGSDRVVDNLIKRIRKKMPGFSIETIYGYGYRLT